MGDETEPNFEEALAQLERIVASLERGEPELTSALSKYEKGVQLLSICHRLLEKAEQSVALLTGVDEQGQPLTAAVRCHRDRGTRQAKRRRRARRARRERPLRVDIKRQTPTTERSECEGAAAKPAEAVAGDPERCRRFASSSSMIQHLLFMRDGRKLEVTEFGDRTGHPAFFFHGLIGSHHQAAYISEEAGRIGTSDHRPQPPRRGPFRVHRSQECSRVCTRRRRRGKSPGSRRIQPDRDFRRNTLCAGGPLTPGTSA